MTLTEFLDALDAASEGATDGPWNEDALPFRHLDAEDTRYIVAHSPSVTAALRACARALARMLDQVNDGDGFTDAAAKQAAEALAALAAAGGGDA